MCHFCICVLNVGILKNFSAQCPASIMHSGYRILVTWKLPERLNPLDGTFRSACYNLSVVVKSHLCTCLLFPAEGAEQLRTQWDGAGREQCQDLWGELSLDNAVYSMCMSCITPSHPLCLSLPSSIQNFILWSNVLISSHCHSWHGRTPQHNAAQHTFSQQHLDPNKMS